MASHGLRGNTLASTRTNLENEAAGAMPRGKMAGGLTEGILGRVTRTRAAMSEIGNKTTLRTFEQKNQLINKGLKKEVTKPARGLTKQKATSSLAGLPEVRVTRRSAERQQVQLMEQETYETEKHEDVEMEDVDDIVSAFSTQNLGPIENIDKDDAQNPQLVVEYVNEIYAYMRHMETVQNVGEDYLKKSASSSGSSILPKMRAVLVDWLIQVHSQFNLLQETLYLTVAILDRFLQNSARTVERKQLQLVGVAAMFIASKYEEMYAPEITDFVYITDSAYSEAQIRQMEIKIMTSLQFELGRPLPLHFLRRNSKAGSVDALVHTLAKYVMELTLVEYKFAHVKPSILAAASLAFSMKVLDKDDKTIREIWSATLVHYSHYTFDTIADVVQQIAAIVMTTTKAPENAKIMAVRKKYDEKKFSRIARLAELSNDSVSELASGDF